MTTSILKTHILWDRVNTPKWCPWAWLEQTSKIRSPAHSVWGVWNPFSRWMLFQETIAKGKSRDWVRLWPFQQGLRAKAGAAWQRPDVQLTWASNSAFAAGATPMAVSRFGDFFFSLEKITITAKIKRSACVPLCVRECMWLPRLLERLDTEQVNVALFKISHLI